MLVTQKKFLDFTAALNCEIESCVVEGKNLLGARHEQLTKDIAVVNEDVSSTELLIPIVGAFSAGKSSLLNAFLGGTLLPVAITPETAIPAELRYAENPRLETFRVDGEMETHEVSALATLQQSAQDYRFIRLYLSNDSLKRIQPFVLVDMPGYDSPLDAHSRAIEQYIAQGTHYVFLVSVEEGALQKQAFRRIDEIRAMGRDFSICLNKTDLRSPQDVDEISRYISDQLLSTYGVSGHVSTLDHDNPDKFMTVLKQIDPEKLMANLFLDKLKSLYFSLDGDLNAAIAGWKRDQKENEQAIEEMNQTLGVLMQERDRRIAQIRSGGASVRVQPILNAVSNSLSSAVDEMIAAQMQGGLPGSLERIVSDVVRSTLLVKLRQAHDDISEEMLTSFSAISIGGLSTTMHVSEDWVDTTAQMLKQAMPMMLAGWLNPDKKKNEQEEDHKTSTTSGQGEALILLSNASPWVKAAMLILPGIIGKLLDDFSETRKREQIRNALMSRMIPDILQQLRPDVESFLKEAAEVTTQAVAGSFEERIKAQESTTAAVVQAQQEKMGQAAQMIETLETVRGNIARLAENTFN